MTSFDLPGRALSGGPSETSQSDRQLSEARPIIDLVREVESPYGDRLTPLDTHVAAWGSRRTLPDDTLVLKSPDGLGIDVVVHCPITGVPFTKHMADAVFLKPQHLQDMVDRQVPLGITRQNWEIAQSAVFAALDSAGLLDENTVVKAGGSSVAGFSSRATALKKKQFPQSAEALREKIEEHGLRQSHYRERIELRAHRAEELWRSFAPAERPRAPWWGIMNRLKIEGKPDVDIQISSAILDRRIHTNRHTSRFVESMTTKDRWSRWDNEAVSIVAPELEELQHQLEFAGIPVDLEFLGGDLGRNRLNERTDWWDVNPVA